MFKIYVRYKLHRKMIRAHYCSTTPSHKSLRRQTKNSCHSIFLSPLLTFLSIEFVATNLASFT